MCQKTEKGALTQVWSTQTKRLTTMPPQTQSFDSLKVWMNIFHRSVTILNEGVKLLLRASIGGIGLELNRKRGLFLSITLLNIF